MLSDQPQDDPGNSGSTADARASVRGFTSDEAQLPPTSFVLEARTEPSADPVHVISMIPGIRDLGIWIDQLDFHSRRNALRIGAEPVALGRINSLRFLSRLGARTRELETLAQLLKIRLLHPTARHSIIAHSYGTEMLGRVIHRIPLDYTAIFLCGAVVPGRAADHLLGKTGILINDCSQRDVWPLVAESLNPWFYQATGTNGFRAVGVRNRFHDCGHGGYLSPEHFERYIVPVLVRRAEVHGQNPRSTWTSHLPTYAHRVLWVLFTVLIAWAVWMAWRRYR
jgi:hypothetical protein